MTHPIIQYLRSVADLERESGGWVINDPLWVNNDPPPIWMVEEGVEKIIKLASQAHQNGASRFRYRVSPEALWGP